MAVPMPNLGAILKPLGDAIRGLTGPVATFSKGLVADLRSITDSFSETGKAVASVATTLNSNLKSGLFFATTLVKEFASDMGAFLGPAFSFTSTLFKELGTDIIGALVDLSSWVASKAPLMFVPFKVGLDVAIASLGAFKDAAVAVGSALVSLTGKAVSATATASVVGFAASLGAKLATGFASATVATVQFVGSVAASLKGMAEASANALKQPFRVLDSLISAAGQGITRYVALYDPGRVAVFQYAVDSLYATIGRALAPAMDAVTQTVKALSSAIAGAGDQGQAMIAAVAAGTVGLIAFAAAMALIQTVATGGVLPIIGALVGALGGLEAVTGGLQPLLDQLAPVLSGLMDAVGGMLATISGAIGGVLPVVGKFVEWLGSLAAMLSGLFEQLAPAIAGVMDVFTALMEAVRPLQELWISILVGGVQLLGQAVAAVAPYIVVFVETMGNMVKQFVGWIREILSIIGIDLPEFGAGGGAPKGNTGQASTPVRGTSTTDVESVLRKARESAFSLGGSGNTPEKQTATNTGQTTQAINDVRKQMNDMANWLMNALPHFLVNEMPNKVLQYMLQVAAMFPKFGDAAKQIERETGEAARGERGVGRIGVDTPAGRIELRDVNPNFQILDAGRRLF